MDREVEAGRLLALAEKRRGGLQSFLADLVRIPSVNGRHSEKAVAERILREAQRLGLPARLAGKDPNRPNALVEWGHGPAGFILVGHMDTVAEGDPAAWSFDPFGAQIDGGRMFGRGAADNKGGIACGLYTLAALAESGALDPAQTKVIVAGVVDEESGASSPLGVRWLLDQHLLAGRGAIYAYASDIVCVGHRGLLRMALKAHGQAVHSGSPEWNQGRAGVNAVTGLADALLRLEKLDIPAPAHPSFQGLTCKLTPGTLFNGGAFESIVPAEASAMVDVRLMPGQDAAQVIALTRQVTAAVEAERPGLHIDIEVKNNLPGAAIPADHPLVALAEDYTRLLTGKAWPVAGAGPANEGYMLIQAGIPTLCGFGPTGGGAHAPDEWVELDSLPRTVAMFTGIIQDYLLTTKKEENTDDTFSA